MLVNCLFSHAPGAGPRHTRIAAEAIPSFQVRAGLLFALGFESCDEKI
jgi:hypothetical protein